MAEQFEADTQKAYEYFAFISYSRKDEKWAKKLQRELEKYRLPMALYKEEESLPKNIRPVFRDVTDLSAGRLQNELHVVLRDGANGGSHRAARKNTSWFAAQYVADQVEMGQVDTSRSLTLYRNFEADGMV